MKRSPATEGWVLMFIFRSRTPSLLGAVLSRPGFMPVAKFVLARLPAIIVWAVVSFFVAVAGMSALLAAWPHVGPVRLADRPGAPGVDCSRRARLLVKRGRYVLAAWWARRCSTEYWPMWLFYLPLVPYLAWLALKHRGLTTLTCCNPGIENGGGLIGESKHAIMTHLPDGPQRLTTVLIEAAPTPAERADKVRARR